MPQQRKVFRIEEGLHADAHPATPLGSGDDLAALRHRELMAELAALRGLLGPQRPGTSQSPANGRGVIADGGELKAELDLIRDAVRATKDDAGGRQPVPFIAPDLVRMGRELDAVLADTEQATQRVLTAAEEIDQIAATLTSLLKDGYACGLAQDARENVVKIFEACNFQDLAGQRITKVIATLKFIEDRVDRLHNVCSRIENVAPPGSAGPAEQGADRKLLNGPKLSGDPGHSTQADVDLIFDSN